jgi:tRNA threonylcarbamoyladenosine biosynthesis protein TsaB
MDEVFHGVFSVSESGVLAALGKEAVSAPAIVMVDQVAVTLGAGNGFQRYAELAKLGQQLKTVEADVLPTGEALIQLAKQWLSNHQPLTADQAQPVYVRNKVAEKPRLP